MPRPLFGFRQVRGRIIPVPNELQVVRAVLAARKGQRMKAARMRPDETMKATARRLERIRSHLRAYRSGRVLLGLPPDPQIAALVKARKL